jgi:hypothetical protein
MPSGVFGLSVSLGDEARHDPAPRDLADVVDDGARHVEEEE